MTDAKFHDLVLVFDTDLAAIARAGRCVVCRSPVHSGNYRRKLRGPLARRLGEEHCLMPVNGDNLYGGGEAGYTDYPTLRAVAPDTCFRDKERAWG